jgi:ABC-type multidrug transport system ATPase subunit
MQSLITIKKLNYTIKEREVNMENITIKNGDFVLVTGPNGVGKSTLLKILVGIDTSNYCKISQGYEIYYNFLEGYENKNLSSYDNEDLDNVKRNVVLIGQDQENDRISTLSAYENFIRPSVIAVKHNKEKIKQIHTQAVEMIEKYIKFNGIIDIVKDMKKKHYKNYSGGQQQLLKIMMHLLKGQILGLKVYIMDEPFNNLDLETKQLLRNVLDEMFSKNEDICIIMVSHCHIFDRVNKELMINKESHFINITKKPYDCLGKRCDSCDC